MAVASYAEPSDIFGTGGYLRDPSAPANTAVMQTFIAVSSRLIDQMCGQIFYDDGFYFQPIDSQGMSHVDTTLPFFFSSGTIAQANAGVTSLTYTASTLAPSPPQNGDKLTLDTASSRETVTINGAVTGTYPTFTIPVTATTIAHAATTVATTLQVELRYFENQPQNQVITTLDGDGVNPPSNFFVWPRTRPRIGAAAASDLISRRPWRGIDISHIPISNTTFLPSSIPGYLTVRVGAHWGWPTVPDLVKDLTCKLAARLWRKRQAGEAEVTGSGDAQGIGDLRQLFDAADEAVLIGSELKVTYI